VSGEAAFAHSAQPSAGPHSDDCGERCGAPEQAHSESEPDAASAEDGDFPGFQKWVSCRGLRLMDAQIHAERMAKWSQRPRFLMISVVDHGNLGLAARTLDSLSRQLYKDWVVVFISDQPSPSELFEGSDQLGWLQLDSPLDTAQVTRLVNALPGQTGSDWVALLPAGFELDAHALLALGDQFDAHPQQVAIYSDDYAKDGAGQASHPRFKPDFDIDHLRSYDYVTPAVWFRAEALAALGGLADLGEASSFEFLLRCWESVGDAGIGHIAETILQLPAESVRVDGDSVVHDAAVLAHIERLGASAHLERGIAPGVRRIVWKWPSQPKVCILVPTRDKLEFVAPCVESLLEKTDYPNYEVLILDNQSEDPDTLDWFAQIQKSAGGRVRVIRWDFPFNYSAINNFGAGQTDADYLCFLNNDTEVLHAEWLARMVELGQRPDVSAVGCRLVYPETGRLQHGGVVVGMGVAHPADRPFNGIADLSTPGPLKRLQVVHGPSAVTAACLLTRRSDFLGLGGFDEVDFKVFFNDVDLCLRFRSAGQRVLWTPYATLVHHGSQSVSGDPSNLRKIAESSERALEEGLRFVCRWPDFVGNDPRYNRNLSLVNQDYALETVFRVEWDASRRDRTRILGLPLSGGSGTYRIKDPFTALSDAGSMQTQFVGFAGGGARLPTLSELARLKPDAIMLHACLDASARLLLERNRRIHPDMRHLFALDDLVTQIPAKSSVYRKFVGQYRDAKPRLRAVLRLCDRLIVSTDPLADLCRGMIDDIVVVPNRLSQVWRGHTSLRNAGTKLRVGWVGAMQHQGDLELIEPVIEALAGEVDFVFMGMATDRIRPNLAEFHDPVPWAEYPAKVASLNLDIALAPLEQVPFNEAKSNLRLLEYGIFGWPVVCTDIYPYRYDNAPVTRVPNESDAWIDAIRALAADPARRAAEGDALQAWVTCGYLLEDHLDDWMCALLR
jgi:GT2 family glycosyltransferase